jgi:hypothetical protein
MLMEGMVAAMGMPKPAGEIRWLGDVQRLALEPGDIVVVSNTGPMSVAEVESLRRQVQEFLPGHRCLVLTSNWMLGVLSEAP